ncbi:enoyl-CoA hydratase-related protein [Actinophytocola oryzae]|uniref:Enoyl-CoA hydratase n=1 Tax=Actinophytocola oryzae TaxID=502181 RepID=A0A4R7VDB1_9PSEU|nr:enoyl-CoA hydratase-related protein [Actinophytocola oryzae]TDV47120.1 enoyl-CoA hydratase [Actinophytocola oryzae]
MTPLLVDDRDGVRTFTLNRPEAFNSLTAELKTALRDALTDTAADPSVRAVVLTGAGKAFCAGQDLKEHITALESPEPFTTVAEHYNPIVRTLTSMPKPVIAAVNGIAAGAGASFAYACDLRVVSRSAKFLMAFATIGLTADSGASWTLPRLVGYGRAMELMLLAKPVTAEQAVALGMATELVEDGEALSAAQELAARMATGPTTGYAKIKEALLTAAGANLEKALATEEKAQSQLGGTADHREAVDAFVAKRPPTFTGH